ncbi:carbohydrate-binding domain-containing protein, partial [Paucibacter sp. XJ19-41]|uniref:carbohydrate-binding domain-containing protein n=1 Tax=Paucibacter sp. XJ19-41 TaxID=2927824 RepID=UPI00234A36B9
VTDSVEVRATQPTDYALAAPTLKPGSKVDVVYANAGAVNGVTRSLYVQQLSTADTAVLPTAAIVSFDRGYGNDAFDGQNVLAGTTNLHGNGALRLAWPSPNLTDRLTVRASATSAGGSGALMVARVDGIVVGSALVSSTAPVDHVFAAPPLAIGSRVDVAFANAATVNGQTRSLRVHYLMSGTTVLQPSAGSMSFDAGSGLAAFDGANVQQTAQNLLTDNGALRGKWPAANMSDTLTLRASARLAANVGPIVQLQVDGVVIGTVELRSPTPADISLPTLPMKPGQRVELVYTNPADGRDLHLAYAISGKTVLLASN